MLLDIVVHQDEGQATVSVSGIVDIHSSSQLRNILHPLFDQKNECIQVELSGVGFMDSSGIATLVEGLQWSQKNGKEFILSGLTDAVRDVFTMSKLDAVFTIK